MAKFAITQSDSSGFAWQVTSLDYAWSTSYYSIFALLKNPFISGSSSVSNAESYPIAIRGGEAISFGSYTPFNSSTAYGWTPSSEYPSGSATFYPMVLVPSGLYWSIGKNNTVPAGQAAEKFVFSEQSRPPLYSWSSTKSSGGVFNLTATEWNNLMVNINQVRAYKGLFTVSYTTAYQGYPFTAAMYNEAHPAVNGMYYYMTSLGQLYMNEISEVNPGNRITAKHLNNLVMALNTVT